MPQINPLSQNGQNRGFPGQTLLNRAVIKMARWNEMFLISHGYSYLG